MTTQEKTSDPLNAVPVDVSPVVCHIDEVPDMYGRLLAEYAPFQVRYWRSSQIRDFLMVPDAVRQELPRASNILQSIQALNEAQLRALARCSSLNVGKLTKRFLFGGANKAFVTFAALLAAAKAVKEIFDINTTAYAVYFTWLIWPLIGFAVGAVFNYFFIVQRLRLVRALDDIISIAVAAKNLKQ